MKTKTPKILSILAGFTLALGLSLSPVRAQSPMVAQGTSMKEDKMMDGCQKMMEQRKTMMEAIKAEDAALTEQVARMNSAPAATKTGLMADILTRLVQQRADRNIRMEKMQAKMMEHMMEHMKMGKDSMKQCPMMKEMEGMKEMKGMDETSESPNEHHEASQ